jgi:hypothetical protein
VVHGDLAQGVLVILFDLEMLGNDVVLAAAFVAAGLKHGTALVTNWRQNGFLIFVTCNGFTTLVENPLARGLSSKVGGKVLINLRPMAGDL